MMGAKLPLKSRLVLEFENEDLWETDAITCLLEDEGTDSDYWKFNARFWMIEMAGSGVLKVVDKKMDDTFYGTEKIIFKYALTKLGKGRIDMLLR